jgi:hypothetical protein
MFHETMWDMYPFLNNVGSDVTEIIWNFDHKFMDPNYVTMSIRRTIRAFYDIICVGNRHKGPLNNQGKPA